MEENKGFQIKEPPEQEPNYIIAAKLPKDSLEVKLSLGFTIIDKETKENNRNLKSVPKAGKRLTLS